MGCYAVTGGVLCYDAEVYVVYNLYVVVSCGAGLIHLHYLLLCF